MDVLTETATGRTPQHLSHSRCNLGEAWPAAPTDADPCQAAIFIDYICLYQFPRETGTGTCSPGRWRPGTCSRNESRLMQSILAWMSPVNHGRIPSPLRCSLGEVRPAAPTHAVTCQAAIFLDYMSLYQSVQAHVVQEDRGLAPVRGIG